MTDNNNITHTKRRTTPTNKKKSCGFKIAIVAIVVAVILTLSIIFIIKFFEYTSEEYIKIMYPLEYSEIVEEMSEKYDVQQELIYAIIKTESNFDEKAESPVGALGLMQIMPTTFEWLQTYNDGEITMDTEELFNPEVNIEYGTIFLQFLLDRYDSIECVAAGYNAGFGAVDEWLTNPEYSEDGVTLSYIPYPETENYVEKVEIAMFEYEKILNENN